MQVDLNCDMGESFGVYTLGADPLLMPLVTSVNIACGFHPGDPRVMERAVRLAIQHHVAIGAHPGYPDLVGFGRRALDATLSEIENDVLYQIGALSAFVRAAGGALTHAKPHGELCRLVAAELKIAQAVARAIVRFDSNLTIIALAGSAMVDATREVGLCCAREGYVDRAYMLDGTLQPRREPGAVSDDPLHAAHQAVELVCGQAVTTVTGEKISMIVDTLCIHSDAPSAVQIARAVSDALERRGVAVATFSKQG